MRTSEAGLDLIKKFEGLRLMPYKDIVGVWTIGYGHTGPEVADTLQWSKEQADVQVACDAQKVEDTLNKLIPADCTQNQFDALVDFGFNLGVGSLRMMVNHGWDHVPQQILRWDKAGGKAVPGLTRRREAEKALFLLQPASDATS